MTARGMDPREPQAWANPVDRLRAIVARLRSPGGCPWDIAQDHLSLRSALVEECFEVIDAIEAGDDVNLREELGDLLLHVVMHTQMAAERGAFDFDATASDLCDKLIRRHPHVFGEESAEDVGTVLARWDEIKRREKASRTSAGSPSAPSSAMDSIPRGLPSVPRALQAQQKAARLGLDWPSAEGVIEKLAEEIAELRSAADSAVGLSEEESVKARIESEIGDILFTGINLARVFKVDPDHALRDATARFIRRVRAVERYAAEAGAAREKLDAKTLDALWERAKAEMEPALPTRRQPEKMAHE